jgi:hypothetical protein
MTVLTDSSASRRPASNRYGQPVRLGKNLSWKVAAAGGCGSGTDGAAGAGVVGKHCARLSSNRV